MSSSASTVLRRALGYARRSLWIVIVAGVALFIAWARLWKPIEVEVVAVDRGDITQEAFGRGTIESQREAAVGFDMVGRFSAVLVDEGDARHARPGARPTRDRPGGGRPALGADATSPPRAARSCGSRPRRRRARVTQIAAASARRGAQPGACSTQGAVADSSATRRADKVASGPEPTSTACSPNAPRRRAGSTSPRAGPSSAGWRWCGQTLLAPFAGLVTASSARARGYGHRGRDGASPRRHGSQCT
jgi:hypothetical protein